jgi:membrane protease YdiL (CAAX protease family)
LPIVIASIIFAVLHLGQGAAPIPLFLLSLGLGYLYRQTGNVTAPLVVHILLNALTMIAKFTETTGAGS